MSPASIAVHRGLKKSFAADEYRWPPNKGKAHRAVHSGGVQKLFEPFHNQKGTQLGGLMP
ncbi:MAG: hypothetical protein IPN59_07065 [Holophaga sp.]|nr:hypothetical protein [Holophaga sp.]